MRRAAMVIVLLGALGAGGWLLWRRVGPGAADLLRAEWSPAVALAPGVGVREGKVLGAPSWRVLDLSIDPSRAELRIAENPAGAKLADLVPPGALAAVNGGYFDARFRPTGWLLDEGRELAPKQSRAQGGVLALAKGKLFVGPSGSLPFVPELALQNSPRLVEPGGAVGIRSDDEKRAARTAACDADGRLHLLTVSAPLGDGPTLLQLARFLAAEPELGGMGCAAALNLDGGPSTGMWLPANTGVPGVATAAPIAYALAVMPR